jgi:hypothetical protein
MNFILLLSLLLLVSSLAFLQASKVPVLISHSAAKAVTIRSTSDNTSAVTSKCLNKEGAVCVPRESMMQIHPFSFYGNCGHYQENANPAIEIAAVEGSFDESSRKLSLMVLVSQRAAVGSEFKLRAKFLNSGNRMKGVSFNINSFYITSSDESQISLQFETVIAPDFNMNSFDSFHLRIKKGYDDKVLLCNNYELPKIFNQSFHRVLSLKQFKSVKCSGLPSNEDTIYLDVCNPSLQSQKNSYRFSLSEDGDNFDLQYQTYFSSDCSGTFENSVATSDYNACFYIGGRGDQTLAKDPNCNPKHLGCKSTCWSGTLSPPAEKGRCFNVNGYGVIASITTVPRRLHRWVANDYYGSQNCTVGVNRFVMPINECTPFARDGNTGSYLYTPYKDGHPRSPRSVGVHYNEYTTPNCTGESISCSEEAKYDCSDFSDREIGVCSDEGISQDDQHLPMSSLLEDIYG